MVSEGAASLVPAAVTLCLAPPSWSPPPPASGSGGCVWAWRVRVTATLPPRKAAGREANAFVGSPGPRRSTISAASSGPGPGALPPLVSPANLCPRCNVYPTEPVEPFTAFFLLSLSAPVKPKAVWFVEQLGQRGGGAVWNARGEGRRIGVLESRCSSQGLPEPGALLEALGQYLRFWDFLEAQR